MIKIIGMVGRQGSGKSFSSSFILNKFPNKIVKIIKISNILKNLIKEKGMQITAKNLQYISNELKKADGKYALRDLIKKEIDNSSGDILIIDGIRGKNIFNLVKNYTNNSIIFFESNSDTRYKRIKKRNEKYGESDLLESDFQETEKSESNLEIEKLKSFSDFVITNNESKENLEKNLEAIIQKIL